jgi:hypothetical protein
MLLFWVFIGGQAAEICRKAPARSVHHGGDHDRDDP